MFMACTGAQQSTEPCTCMCDWGLVPVCGAMLYNCTCIWFKELISGCKSKHHQDDGTHALHNSCSPVHLQHVEDHAVHHILLLSDGDVCISHDHNAISTGLLHLLTRPTLHCLACTTQASCHYDPSCACLAIRVHQQWRITPILSYRTTALLSVQIWPCSCSLYI